MMFINIPTRYNRGSAGAGKYWRKRACFFLFLVSISYIINTNIDLSFAKEERDPFVSLNEKGRILEESFDISKLPYSVKLNGIIWKRENSVAIINTEIVQKGDIWRDLKVEEIKKDRIILKYGDFSFEILMEEEKAKKF